MLLGLIAALLMPALGWQDVSAQDMSPEQQALKPLAEVLNSDGTINREAGFTGSVDPQGWRMVTGRNSEPRFVRADEGASAAAPGRALAAVAADVNWDERFGMAGTYLYVYSLAISGSDVYVGCYCANIGGLVTNNVAKWNGRSWSALGTGVPGGSVYAIAVAGSRVYIGGDFQTAGTATNVNSVAVWNTLTLTWAPLNNGTTETNGVKDSYGYPGDVHALATASDGGVYVGGSFTIAGTATVNSIAKWKNGWSPVGRGVGGYSKYEYDGTESIYAGTVHTLVRAGNSLYVGGSFEDAVNAAGAGAVEGVHSIVKWDIANSKWSRLGRGVGTDYTSSISMGTVKAIAVNGTDIYVGGDFPAAFNPTGLVTANSIARWNGTAWSGLGTGMATTYGRGTVRTLAVYENRIIVGGNFATAGGTASPNIARWNPIASPARWEAMSGGVDGEVYTVAPSTAGLFVGGNFGKADGLAVNYIARWAGTRWHTLGEGVSQGSCCGYIKAVAVDHLGNVYVGGYFTNAGSTIANSIARWDGRQWNVLGTPTLNGVKDTSWSGTVYALAVDGDNVYVGGDFSTAGNVSANNVARYNRANNSWAALASGITGYGVYALKNSGNYVYAGGSFGGAGNTTAENLARWNKTTRAWEKFSNLDFGDGSVRAIEVYGTGGRSVYVGGDFSYFNLGRDAAGNYRYAYANGLMMWDSTVAPGTNPLAGWYLPGDGVEYQCGSSRCAGDINALAIVGNALYVGGDFEYAGTDEAPTTNSIAARSIAKLDIPSNTWSPLGDVVGGGYNQEVYALAPAGAGVYVGGDFTTVGAKTVNSLAHWTGKGWVALGSGLRGISGQGYGYAIATSGAGVYAGGDFDLAGGKPAANFAKYGTAPNIALNPGFELDANADTMPDNWTMSATAGSTATATRTTSVDRTGAASLKQTATDNATLRVTQRVSGLAGGRCYTVSAWTNIGSTSDAFTWRLEVVWRNNTTPIRTDVVKTFNASTKWAEAIGTLLAPAGTNNAVVQLVSTSLRTTIYTDDVAFRLETAPSTAPGVVAGADANALVTPEMEAVAGGDPSPTPARALAEAVGNTTPPAKPVRGLRLREQQEHSEQR